GQVFKARHRHLHTLVALKRVHKDRVNSDEAVRRFKREVYLTSRLSHPNVVKALNAGEEGGTVFLVLELVEGTNLSRLITERGRLPVADACEYVRQAALGLQHAFEQGLTHRDIKPSNLMLSKGGVVKLLDLGLSHAEPNAAADTTTSLTDTGRTMGTPD